MPDNTAVAIDPETLKILGDLAEGAKCVGAEMVTAAAENSAPNLMQCFDQDASNDANFDGADVKTDGLSLSEYAQGWNKVAAKGYEEYLEMAKNGGSFKVTEEDKTPKPEELGFAETPYVQEMPKL